MECLIKELNQIAWCACKHLAIAVDFNVDIRISLLLQNVRDHCDQGAVNLDGVGVTQGQEAIIQRIVTAAELPQRVVILKGPIDDLQCLVWVQIYRFSLPVVAKQLQYVHV